MSEVDDVHQHRRHDDDDAPRLQRIARSEFAVAAAQFGTPILLAACIGLIGWIGNGFNARLDEQGKDLQQVKSDLRVLGTRLDAQVIRQVDSNTRHISNLEGRVQDLERTGPVR